jgi:hypothetical protein
MPQEDGMGLVERDPRSGLPARRVQDVLESLARAPGAGDVALPACTLHLDTGASFTGAVVALSQHDVVLALEGGRGPLDTLFVAVAAVRACVVHATPQNLHTISGGALVAPPPMPVGKLDVERAAQDAAARIREAVGRDIPLLIEWTRVPDDGSARARLMMVVKDLAAHAQAAASNEAGRAAWAVIDAVRVVVGDQVDVVKDRRALLVRVRATGKDIDALAGPALAAAIDRAL